MNHPALLKSFPVAALLALSPWSAAGELLSLTNYSFEDDGIGSGDFVNTTPSGWVRIVPAGRTVGVIGETRSLMANTSDGVAWAHLQTAGGDPNAGDNPPRIGQKIGALGDSLFGDSGAPNLWLHCIASRRLNESTTVHVTASLFAVPPGAAAWTGGTLVDSAVVDTNLANLNDGDPGSVKELAFSLNLNNAAAQATHPGGDYWIVLANTMAGDGTGGQLHLDRVSAQTGDATDPGPNIPPPPPITAADHVAGNAMLINDNGGWCWYQDERVIVDRDTGALVVSSGANYLGYGGEPRDGDLDITTFEHASGRRTVATLATIPTLNKGDDHNVPAIWQRPDGRYFAKYTGHNYGAGYNGGETEPKSFHRTTTAPSDGSVWDAEQPFTWPENGTGEDDVTYTNVHFMSAEGSGQGRLYNIARADDRTPAIATSDDLGTTWSYGGRLSNSTTGSSYSNGYFVFAGNGIDRIDFFCTEHHPHDYSNSIYHGYIKGGKSYNSFGTVIDSDIFDESAPAPQSFTRVWATSPVTATSFHHGWTMEIEVINGTVYALFSTRYGTAQTQNQPGDGDHRLFYARFDGTEWHVTEVCKMGDGLHSGQNDYTGLGSIHPNDPSVIYVSVEHDPRTGAPLPKHEIFKGVTPDAGITWNWTPITENSTVENLRPIVPEWAPGYTALLWLRGYYPYQRDYDESVIAMVERPDQEVGLVRYHDAAPANTTRADGSAFTPTGPADGDGAGDDQWHINTLFGNGASVFTVNETAAENAPALKTSVGGLDPGSYDVFAYFWSRPAADWRIRAGFSASELLVFRRYSCQQAEAAQFDAPVKVLDSERALYRAYVGRRTIAAGESVEVIVDDFDAAAVAGTQRASYDGLGVARVLPVLHVAPGETFNLPPGSGPYASLTNSGTLVGNAGSLDVTGDIINGGTVILGGGQTVAVGGTFLNNGVLDLINWTGVPDSGWVNHGTILERSLVRADAIVTVSDDVKVIIAGYAGHTYQLQYSPNLQADNPGWQDLGAAVQGTGANGISVPIEFLHPGGLNSSPRRFYRIQVGLAP